LDEKVNIDKKLLLSLKREMIGEPAESGEATRQLGFRTLNSQLVGKIRTNPMRKFN